MYTPFLWCTKPGKPLSTEPTLTILSILTQATQETINRWCCFENYLQLFCTHAYIYFTTANTDLYCLYLIHSPAPSWAQRRYSQFLFGSSKKKRVREIGVIHSDSKEKGKKLEFKFAVHTEWNENQKQTFMRREGLDLLSPALRKCIDIWCSGIIHLCSQQ